MGFQRNVSIADQRLLVTYADHTGDEYILYVQKIPRINEPDSQWVCPILVHIDGVRCPLPLPKAWDVFTPVGAKGYRMLGNNGEQFDGEVGVNSVHGFERTIQLNDRSPERTKAAIPMVLYHNIWETIFPDMQTLNRLTDFTDWQQAYAALMRGAPTQQAHVTYPLDRQLLGRRGTLASRRPDR